MKPKNRSLCILALLSALLLVGTAAHAATIDVMGTFDYPGTGKSTLPQKISDQADIVGTVIGDITKGGRMGFIYKIRLQKFSAQFSAPNDTGHLTNGRGINIRRHLCGEYLNGTDGTYHGYLVFHPDFQLFDVTGAVDTIPLGINNNGDFVGGVTLTDGTQPAFMSLKQRITMFAVPNATATYAYQLNTVNAVIGYYTDASGMAHGYTRDSVGNLSFPIDVPGATGTFLLGNNDSNWGVGRYTDSAGVTHGLFFITPDSIQTYDYPGAIYTSVNGVNKDGYVCGSYEDAAGLFHGFWGIINLTASSKDVPMAPIKPANRSIEKLRAEAPVL